MRLCVFLPNWIGDACMATPALRAIASLPDLEELTLVGRAGPLALLENEPYAKVRIPFKPRSKSESILGRRALAKELRQRSVDTILLMPNSLSSAAIARVAGIPRRIGFARDGRSWLLTDAIPLHEARKDTKSHTRSWRESPAIDYYLRLASELGCRADDRSMELCVSPEDKEMSCTLLGQVGFSRAKKLVVMNNSSASASARLWPIPYVVDACGKLARDGVQVLIHASPSDREMANALAATVAHPNVQSMGKTENLPLGLSRGVLSMADAVVSTDSGVRHIAVALNRRVVSLFGPTNSSLTTTYNIPELLIENSLQCRPCLKDICPVKHHRCMSQLSTDRVLQAVRSVLSRSMQHAA
ncbi:MAG: lipopolysaccharide heptosyltransferase II [Pirellula sp.]